ncbi:hypothetical protein GF324_03635 [bacterium]|nr:hypothetical protein [bacterium]
MTKRNLLKRGMTNLEMLQLRAFMLSNRVKEQALRVKIAGKRKALKHEPDPQKALKALQKQYIAVRDQLTTLNEQLQNAGEAVEDGIKALREQAEDTTEAAGKFVKSTKKKAGKMVDNLT